MSDYELTMSLPSVVRADSSDIAFPSGTPPLEVSYDYAGFRPHDFDRVAKGRFLIRVGGDSTDSWLARMART